MEPRLILFDIDGTLVDTSGSGRAALRRAFSQTFGPETVGDFAARTSGVRFSGMTDPTIIAALADALDCGDRLATHATVLETRYLEALQQIMAQADARGRVIPGIRELLTALHDDRRITLGLVTGNIEAGARIKLEPFGLNPFFRGGGFGSDHADRRRVARIAVDRLSQAVGREYPPEQVTVIGDTEQDVDCAHANGYRAVAVATGWVGRDVLEAARPDAILDTIDASAETLRALWGPEFSAGQSEPRSS